MSVKFTEILNKTSIKVRFPEDTPITIDIDSSFSHEDFSNGVADTVLLEAHELAILALQISRDKLKEKVKNEN